MTTHNDLGALLPSRWQPAVAAGPIVDVEATASASIEILYYFYKDRYYKRITAVADKNDLVSYRTKFKGEDEKAGFHR